MDEYQIVKEMAERYNSGELNLTNEKLEKLARLTFKHGIDFDVKSRPISKGLFDLVDTASFGMVPNKWRPTSIGQEYHGESSSDRVAGGLGSLVGLGTGIGLGIKGARAMYGSFQGGRAAEALATVKEMEAANRARNYASNLYNQGRNRITDPFGIDDVLDFSNLQIIP